ncbi:MAG: thiamine pyrophosphate-dependent dehydrogenase E1 component subunit alpha, partial [Thermoanaerobaculia bacterium]
MTVTETGTRRAAFIARFAAFVAERHPLALKPALTAIEQLTSDAGFDERNPVAVEQLRDPLPRVLEPLLIEALSPSVTVTNVPETTPGVTVNERLHQAITEIIEDCDGFISRDALAGSLSNEERIEILRGMLLTRATDNRLKQFFTGGEVRYGSSSFQGKGFRSLGQEAIYAATIRLRRAPEFRDAGGTWNGDVISPMIRDLGAVIGMHNAPETIRMVLSAQMGKAGPPMNGRDLHIGEWSRGILPAMAPLGSPALTIAGIAMAFSIDNTKSRVAISFVGEGATSLGEWHEAINACAARKLPAIFCVQNNQTALSTPVNENSAVRVFADKAIGYGIPAMTIDGTDPDTIAGAFTWAAERARHRHGPALIELVSMRMCGHAHHDDMLYLGKDPQPSWSYPSLAEGGYANRELWDYWCRKDPIETYAARLEAEGVIASGDVDRWKREAEELVEREARVVIEAPWPEATLAGRDVVAGGERRVRVEVLDESVRRRAAEVGGATLSIEDAPPFDAKGKTFLEAVML